MAQLTGPQMKQLLDALLQAFDRQALVELLLFRLNRDIDQLASSDDDLREATTKVIKRANQEGWIADLLRAAAAERPHLLDLQILIAGLLVQLEPRQPNQQVLSPGPTGLPAERPVPSRFALPAAMALLLVVGAVVLFALRPWNRTEVPSPPTMQPTATTNPTPTAEAPDATRQPTPTRTTIPTPTNTDVPPPTDTPDPIYSRSDRVSGMLTYRGAPVEGIPLALIASSQCDVTKVSKQTETDDQGRYYFLDVAPGSYTMAINGWNGTGTAVEPFEQSCTWELKKTDVGALPLNWGLHKTDLRITSPVEGTSIGNTTPSFQWEPYPGATRYDVSLIQETPTRETVQWGTPAEGTSFSQAQPLIPGAGYWLLVWASDAGGQIAVGSIRFQVQ